MVAVGGTDVVSGARGAGRAPSWTGHGGLLSGAALASTPDLEERRAGGTDGGVLWDGRERGRRQGEGGDGRVGALINEAYVAQGGGRLEAGG